MSRYVCESAKDLLLGIISKEGYPTVECTQLQSSSLSFHFIFAFHFRALHFYCV